MSKYFDWNRFVKVIPQILPYFQITLKMVVVVVVIATLLAIFLAVLRINKIPVIHQILGFYISYMRDTPLLCQLFVIYYGLPVLIRMWFGININRWNAIYFAEIALILNEAAFMGETFRGAIESVPKVQREAGFSIGLSRGRVFTRIVLPQAIRVIIPSYGNSVAGMFQATSLCYQIGVLDLMGRASSLGSATSHLFEPYFVVAIIYIIVSLIIKLIFDLIEKKMNYGIAYAK